MKQKLYDLKHKRAQALEGAKEALSKKDMETYKARMAEVDGFNTDIDATEKLLAEEGRFDDNDAHLKGLHLAQQQQKEADAQARTVDDIRGSNEYGRAFATAMKNQAQVKKAAGVEAYKPLYKALTATGGTPEGADGGFLVPIDFDNRIQKLEKEYFDLSRLFHVETVNTLTGWRVVEDGIPKPLPSIAEMGTIGKDDQPKFRQINYAVEKFADRLPISGELIDDNAANLLAYVADWFAPKYILTKNLLLLPFLTGLANVVDLPAEGEDKALRAALIQQLNTAHSRAAVLLTNQSGYAAMDGWADTTGRPMLVPNPTDPQSMRYRARPVEYADDDLIPVEAGGAPIYVGNFKALGTLFVRKGIELATTDVGGDAWATDSYEVRAICRLDAQKVQESAAFKALLPDAAGGGG